MEAIEEHTTNLPGTEIIKTNTLENEDEAGAVAANLCHKSNGVAEIGEAGQQTAGRTEGSAPPETDIAENTVKEIAVTDIKTPSETDVSSKADTLDNEIDKTAISETSVNAQLKEEDISTLEVNEVVTEVVIDHETDRVECPESDSIKVDVIEASPDDTPKFRTEILIEANDSVMDTPENMLTDADEHDTPNNLLGEFGESIELSDDLRTDITVTSENNNSSVRQEVFNKEELLDILEGNDVEPTSGPVTDNKPVSLAPSIETKLALQQLSRLKNQKRRYRIPARTVKVKKDIKDTVEKEKPNCIESEEHVEKKKSNQIESEKTVDSNKISNVEDKANAEKKKSVPAQSSKCVENEQNCDKIKSENSTNKKQVSKDNATADNIVNVLVMDWDDEESTEPDQPNQTVVKSGDLQNETESIVKNEENNEEKPLARPSVDSVPNEDPAPKLKSGDENQPQRRLARVIKKKVIFDPDNPDTFTKTKAKNRESVKEHTGKEGSQFKKGKVDQQISKSKSPMSNLQWKKPSSRNSKQNKRLTEVDKLLMDEGAVNMIYQLTPEAPKGKKSRETKAEFIKKIQSSTPDGKEMKFRERKKEILKYEDGEAKKILGAKHRVSLNSSIKSPSVSEDFETHSADDSIIYRRHSSSSYSSSCMSPRRLSDVDSSMQSSTRMSQVLSDSKNHSTPNAAATDQSSDVFMAENAHKSNSEIINKDDYLSIKEKLNSKLSLALNKRKRESNKNDKPLKQKKVARYEEKHESLTKTLSEFKYVAIKINQRLAEICIEKIGLKYNIEVLKEIEQALAFVNSIKDTSVTLLTSKCGTLCSNLDLKLMIEEDKVQRIKNALEVAETIRCLLVAMDKHSKLVCAGVQARCSGVGLALAALADVLLASEGATFTLANEAGSPQPAVGALTARCGLPRSMVNDLVLFGRQLSASEALQGGLVSKILWPNRFNEQVYTIAKDIAAEPAPSVMLKKQLINLKKSEENEQTFLSYLDTERDIFVEYWTSVEGQELLRAAENTA